MRYTALLPCLLLLAACQSDQQKLERLRSNVAEAHTKYQFWYDSARRVRRRESDLRESQPKATTEADSLERIARALDDSAGGAKDRELLAQRDLDRFLK